MVVLTTASSPDHFAYQGARACSRPLRCGVRGAFGAARRGWIEARLEEQRLRLPDAVFEQLFLNEWTQAEGSVP